MECVANGPFQCSVREILIVSNLEMDSANYTDHCLLGVLGATRRENREHKSREGSPNLHFIVD